MGLWFVTAKKWAVDKNAWMGKLTSDSLLTSALPGEVKSTGFLGCDHEMQNPSSFPKELFVGAMLQRVGSAVS